MEEVRWVVWFCMEDGDEWEAQPWFWYDLDEVIEWCNKSGVEEGYFIVQG